jgi:hypothetical protein
MGLETGRDTAIFLIVSYMASTHIIEKCDIMNLETPDGRNYSPNFTLRTYDEFNSFFGKTKGFDADLVAVLYDDGGSPKKAWCTVEYWNTNGPFVNVMTARQAQLTYNITPADFKAMKRLPIEMYPVVFSPFMTPSTAPPPKEIRTIAPSVGASLRATLSQVQQQRYIN